MSRPNSTQRATESKGTSSTSTLIFPKPPNLEQLEYSLNRRQIEYDKNNPKKYNPLRINVIEKKDKTSLNNILFKKDKKGRLILTKKILYDEMKKTYNTKLRKVSRFSIITTVYEVMKHLDTSFYGISLHQKYGHAKFLYKGNEYSAEEVNYIGVGLGFMHFHIFGTRIDTSKQMVELWNFVKYLKGTDNLATEGEKYWTYFGLFSYNSVVRQFRS